MGKADLDPNFRELFVALNRAKVKYLLIGGYAVTYYGKHRYTRDIDLWIATDSQNAQRVSTVLREWGGFPIADVAPQLFQKTDRVYVLGREPWRVDILTSIPGVAFDDCWDRRVVVDMDGVQVPLISLQDLIKNKIASGRARDQDDVETLSAASKKSRKRRTKK